MGTKHLLNIYENYLNKLYDSMKIKDIRNEYNDWFNSIDYEQDPACLTRSELIDELIYDEMLYKQDYSLDELKELCQELKLIT
jgi:hypothetical protein